MFKIEYFIYDLFHSLLTELIHTNCIYIAYRSKYLRMILLCINTINLTKGKYQRNWCSVNLKFSKVIQWILGFFKNLAYRVSPPTPIYYQMPKCLPLSLVGFVKFSRVLDWEECDLLIMFKDVLTYFLLAQWCLLSRNIYETMLKLILS